MNELKITYLSKVETLVGILVSEGYRVTVYPVYKNFPYENVLKHYCVKYERKED